MLLKRRNNKRAWVGAIFDSEGSCLTKVYYAVAGIVASNGEKERNGE